MKNIKVGDTIYYIGVDMFHRNKPGIAQRIGEHGARIKFKDGKTIDKVWRVLLTKTEYFAHELDKTLSKAKQT